jgi:predicted thioredoxin/glutaredoxin
MKALVKAKAIRSLEIIDAEVATLEKNFPSAYQQILAFLAEGASPAKISEFTTVDAYIIRRIRDGRSDAVEKMKERLVTNLAEASLRLSERMVESADKLKPKEIPQSLAVAIDKHQLLSGGVTARTEHRNVPTPEELQDMFNSLPRANARVIEDKES